MLLNKGDSIPKIGERESGASMSEERKIIESNHYKISRLVDMKKSLIIKELLVIIPLFVAGIVCLIVFFVSTRNMYNENFTALIVGFAFLMLTFIPIIIFNNKILFKTGNLKFESRLINGTYPNTSNLLPDESFLIVSTNLNDFYDVIDRVSILTSDKEKNIVTLETNGNTLILKSSSLEIGRVEEKMPIHKNTDEDIKISFSAKYMMEALKSFSTETVDIHFVGEIKPILIKSSEDETLTQLVLPIRTY